MIKIKVFQSRFSHKGVGNGSVPVADYYYCVYLFGFLVHSVTVRDVEKGDEERIFGDRIIKHQRK